MEFATLAAFLFVAMVLCTGERALRARVARRSGDVGLNRQRPGYLLATAVKLLSRRPSRGDTRPPGRGRWPDFSPAMRVAAALLALATLPFGRDLQLLPSSSGVVLVLAALALAALAAQPTGGDTADATEGPPAAAPRGLVVPVNLAVLLGGVVLIPGTADLAGIVRSQQVVFEWFAWRQPVGLALAAVLVLLVREREPALPGWADGVSAPGPCDALQGLGAVLLRVFPPALIVTLYLGGWSPGLTLPAGPWWTLLSALTFLVKTLLLIYGLLWIERFVPRFRPDQTQRVGWTVILPCAVANLLLTAACVTLYHAFSGPPQLATP